MQQNFSQSTRYFKLNHPIAAELTAARHAMARKFRIPYKQIQLDFQSMKDIKDLL